MATKAQIAAVAAAQKEVDKQLEATKKLASVLEPKITTPDNVAFGLPATPKLTAEEEKIFGVYEDSSGRIVPGVRPVAAATSATSTTSTTSGITAVPGSTGLAAGATRTLARDTFANTFALIFGSKEASQPYVGKLYDLVSGFYKTGSTVDDALNLAIRQAREEKVIPEFTKRFAGIFALDDQFKAGKAISVPTIAEFFAAEAKMGEVLTNAGLGDLATQEFLGNVIGLGKSVLEVGNLISNTFSTIDNAPASLKADFATYFPGVDRVSIARALLTGPEGAAELDKRIKGISVLSAAGSQGIKTDLATASDIAAQGYDYQQSLTGFGTVNQLQRANTLAEFGGNKFTQAQAISATFGKSIEEKKKLEQIDALERARYAARSGLSQNALGANTKGAGLI